MSEFFTYSLNMSNKLIWNRNIFAKFINFLNDINISIYDSDNKINILFNTNSIQLEHIDHLIEVLDMSSCFLYIFSDNLEIFTELPKFNNFDIIELMQINLALDRVFFKGTNKIINMEEMDFIYNKIIEFFNPNSGDVYDEIGSDLLVSEFLTDEYKDFFTYWEFMIKQKIGMKRPILLLSINYFSNEYLNLLSLKDKEFLLSRPYKTNILETGLLIKFFKYPFDSKKEDWLNKMKNINSEWLNLDK